MLLGLPAMLLAHVKLHHNAIALQATRGTRQQYLAEVDQGVNSAAAEAVKEAVSATAEGCYSSALEGGP